MLKLADGERVMANAIVEVFARPGLHDTVDVAVVLLRDSDLGIVSTWSPTRDSRWSHPSGCWSELRRSTILWRTSAALRVTGLTRGASGCAQRAMNSGLAARLAGATSANRRTRRSPLQFPSAAEAWQRAQLGGAGIPYRFVRVGRPGR